MCECECVCARAIQVKFISFVWHSDATAQRHRRIPIYHSKRTRWKSKSEESAQKEWWTINGINGGVDGGTRSRWLGDCLSGIPLHIRLADLGHLAALTFSRARTQTHMVRIGWQRAQWQRRNNFVSLRLAHVHGVRVYCVHSTRIPKRVCIIPYTRHI